MWKVKIGKLINWFCEIQFLVHPVIKPNTEFTCTLTHASRQDFKSIKAQSTVTLTEIKTKLKTLLCIKTQNHTKLIRVVSYPFQKTQDQTSRLPQSHPNNDKQRLWKLASFNLLENYKIQNGQEPNSQIIRSNSSVIDTTYHFKIEPIAAYFRRKFIKPHRTCELLLREYSNNCVCLYVHAYAHISPNETKARKGTLLITGKETRQAWRSKRMHNGCHGLKVRLKNCKSSVLKRKGQQISCRAL